MMGVCTRVFNHAHTAIQSDGIERGLSNHSLGGTKSLHKDCRWRSERTVFLYLCNVVVFVSGVLYYSTGPWEVEEQTGLLSGRAQLGDNGCHLGDTSFFNAMVPVLVFKWSEEIWCLRGRRVGLRVCTSVDICGVNAGTSPDTDRRVALCHPSIMGSF